MAFGPDQRLYVMLPAGLEFVNEPSASAPRAAMLRLTDEGRIASGEQLSGVTSTPLGFAWNDAGALWVMLRGESGEAAMRSLDGRNRVPTSAEASAGGQPMGRQAPRLLAREGTGVAARTLLVRPEPDGLAAAREVLGARADGTKGIARLALPARNWVDGMSDRVGDVVAGEGGTLFVATSNGLIDGAADVVVRLKPVPATAGTRTGRSEASPRRR
jgi:hypothetical protein